MEVNRREFFEHSVLGTGTALAQTSGLVSAKSRPRQKDNPLQLKPLSGAHATLNPWRLQPVDLRRFIRLGVEHIYQGTLNRRQGCLPFFRFNLTNPPTWSRHEYWAVVHVAGRFLDALAVSSSVLSFKQDPKADQALRQFLHTSLDNPTGLALDYRSGVKSDRQEANMHHCREVLLGLVGLMQWKGCETSAKLARQFVRTLHRVTRDTGSFPAHVWNSDGWGTFDSTFLNSTSGRLVGALVKYYRASKDELAVDLARRFADVNIEKTFSAEGELKEAAGTHLHSTEGTMTSLLALGATTGEKKYLELGRRLYEVGLRKWRTSYGWARESRNLGGSNRGEANNTGDFIEAALIMGQNGYPEYFRHAERFIRNGLLASQIITTDWITETEAIDAGDYVYSGVRRRARGGFSFTTPSGYHSYNTDLTGGSLQSLCEAYHAIVSDDGQACYVNMLLSVDSPWLRLQSNLPEAGELRIDLRRSCTLFVRIPEWVNRQSVRLEINGNTQPPRWREGELAIGDLPAQSAILVTFEQAQRSTQEKAPGYSNPFELEWLGDTITTMRPSQGLIVLY